MLVLIILKSQFLFLKSEGGDSRQKISSARFTDTILMTQLTKIEPVKCLVFELKLFSDEMNLWNSCSAECVIPLYHGGLAEVPTFFF